MARVATSASPALTMTLAPTTAADRSAAKVRRPGSPPRFAAKVRRQGERHGQSVRNADDDIALGLGRGEVFLDMRCDGHGKILVPADD
jgi:hypothetical protein